MKKTEFQKYKSIFAKLENTLKKKGETKSKKKKE